MSTTTTIITIVMVVAAIVGTFYAGKVLLRVISGDDDVPQPPK